VKKVWADKWVKALRSGKYTQGRGRLKTTTGRHCCLGVLCDITGEGSWKKDPYSSRKIFVIGDVDSGDNIGAIDLPGAVQDLVGLKSDYGEFPDGRELEVKGKVVKSLAQANDKGATFKDIAKFIEKNWRRL
jgi:hypothetical protein